jgi:phosphatidylserine decarboxylase
MSSPSANEIKFWHRGHGRLETELVYGEGFIRYLYQNDWGKRLNRWLASAWASKAYGVVQDLPVSHRKVRPFIEKFGVNIDEYERGTRSSLDAKDSYASFNEFFVRRFRMGKRPFVHEPHRMPAFAEARYVGHAQVGPETVFPVKGVHLGVGDLLGNQDVARPFLGGPLLIARLCPVDYHRFHYPDTGKVIDQWRVKGRYDSVNPVALRTKPDIFIANERHVTLIQTENFGRIAYIEVGAVCVGKIVQTHRWNKPFLRGEEKGYFLFGGSTVVVLGEPGAWRPSADILAKTSEGIETYLRLGEEVAVKG